MTRPAQVPATDSPSPAAWAFVLSQSRVIASAARRTWSDPRMEMEDFHHELILDIGRNFHKFDPSRGGPSTWVFVRARKVKDRELRRLRARKDRDHSTRSLDGIVDTEEGAAFQVGVEPGGYGSPETIVAKVTVAQVIAMASPLQAAAVISCMEGWTGEEVRQSFGCSMSARNDRLNRLGRRVEKTDAPE